MRSAMGLVLAAMLVSGCAGTRFAEGLARERADLGSYKVRSQDGQFEGAVRAKREPDVRAGDQAGVYTVTIALGTEQPVVCRVDRETVDPAQFVRTLVNLAPGTRELAKLDVGVVGESPFFYAEWLYGEPPTRMGLLKLLVAHVSPGSLACWHDEVGYRETFRRLAEEFGKSLHFSPEHAVRQREIGILRVDSQSLGFFVAEEFDLSDGERGESHRQSMMIPRSTSDVFFADELTKRGSDETGVIQRLDAVKVENGDMKHRVEVIRERTGDYRVGGQVRGQPLAERFAGTPPLVDGPTTRSRVRAAMSATSQPALSLREYHPSIDPAKPVDASLRIGADRRAGTLTAAGHDIPVTLDDQGGVSAGIVPGPAGRSIVFERVIVRRP